MNVIDNAIRKAEGRLKHAANLIASLAKSALTQRTGTPSSPGEYPAKQTGELSQSIVVSDATDGDLNGYDIALTAEHAKYLAGSRKLLGSIMAESLSEIEGIIKR